MQTISVDEFFNREEHIKQYLIEYNKSDGEDYQDTIFCIINSSRIYQLNPASTVNIINYSNIENIYKNKSVTENIIFDAYETHHKNIIHDIDANIIVSMNIRETITTYAHIFELKYLTLEELNVLYFDYGDNKHVVNLINNTKLHNDLCL